MFLNLLVFANIWGSLSTHRRQSVSSLSRSIGNRLRSRCSELWTIWSKTSLVCCCRRVWRLYMSRKWRFSLHSPRYSFKCIRLFRCETGVPDWICVFHDKSNDCFFAVHKIRWWYTSLFELLESPWTFRCLGYYCSSVVSPSEQVGNSYWMCVCVFTIFFLITVL